MVRLGDAVDQRLKGGAVRGLQRSARRPDRACRGRRSCRWRRSRARRRSRSAWFPSAVRATGCARSHRSAPACRGSRPPVSARSTSAMRGDGRQARAFAGFEPQVGAQRLRQQQDVGKQDRRVKAVAADRLQRDFGGKVGVVAQRQEIARPAPGWRGIPAGSGRPGASSRSAGWAGFRPAGRAGWSCRSCRPPCRFSPWVRLAGVACQAELSGSD